MIFYLNFQVIKIEESNIVFSNFLYSSQYLLIKNMYFFVENLKSTEELKEKKGITHFPIEANHC